MTEAEKLSTSMESLRTEMLSQMAAIREEMLGYSIEMKSVIRFAMSGNVSPQKKLASLTDTSALTLMTSKQHAAMQMWLTGMKFVQIAKRMGCSRNTARIHVKALWTKMRTEDRDDISRRLVPIIDAASDAEYEEWSGGLPKNWHETYEVGGIDPFLKLYIKSKEDSYAKDRGKTRKI